MANIRIDLNDQIMDGMNLTFKAPCDCTEVTGIKVYYPGEDGTVGKEFSFRDAHNNDLADLGDLFAEGAYVRVVLDTTNNYAYLQNADTNGYLEAKIPSIKFGNTVAYYYSGGWLKADVNVGVEYDGKVPVVTMMYVEQTPYTNVDQTLTTAVTGGKFTVWFRGYEQSFVTGHVLQFAYAVGI